MAYVLDILLVTAFGFAIVTLAVGLIMLIAPDKVHAAAARLDVFISTEEYFAFLDSKKFIDKYIYKYHHFFGIFIIVGSIYTIVMLAPLQGSEYRALPELISPVISSWIYDAIVISLLFFCSLVTFIGIIIFFRPSALKTFEAKMNTWNETSHLIKPLDEQRYLEQQKPLKKPRLFGFIVLSGSLYILWQTAPSVFN